MHRRPLARSALCFSAKLAANSHNRQPRRAFRLLWPLLKTSESLTSDVLRKLFTHQVCTRPTFNKGKLIQQPGKGGYSHSDYTQENWFLAIQEIEQSTLVFEMLWKDTYLVWWGSLRSLPKQPSLSWRYVTGQVVRRHDFLRQIKQALEHCAILQCCPTGAFRYFGQLVIWWMLQHLHTKGAAHSLEVVWVHFPATKQTSGVELLK